MLNNKTILITGGTGSLGKALTLKILQKYRQLQGYNKRETWCIQIFARWWWVLTTL